MVSTWFAHTMEDRYMKSEQKPAYYSMRNIKEEELERATLESDTQKTKSNEPIVLVLERNRGPYHIKLVSKGNSLKQAITGLKAMIEESRLIGSQLM